MPHGSRKKDGQIQCTEACQRAFEHELTIEDTIHSDEHRLFFNEGQKVYYISKIMLQ